MPERYNFKKEWPKIKKQLLDLSQDAVALAKKGEKELIKVSHQGKLHIDSTALNLKKEHLFHLIGKEYVSSKAPGVHSQKMKQYLADLAKINKEIRGLNQKMKPRKRSVKRKTGVSQ